LRQAAGAAAIVAPLAPHGKNRRDRAAASEAPGAFRLPETDSVHLSRHALMFTLRPGLYDRR